MCSAYRNIDENREVAQMLFCGHYKTRRRYRNVCHDNIKMHSWMLNMNYIEMVQNKLQRHARVMKLLREQR
jgi:hypothetical protein